MSGAPVEREPGGIDPAVGAPAPDDGIAAVVVSHRSASTLDDCLLRLRGAHGVAQIRVVDNASDDATLEIVQRHALADPRLRFIANPDNPGFAVACNQGAAASDAPWLAFVNPDLRVRPDSLARLRAHALALPAPALLGADLLGEDGVRDGAARRRDPDFAAMLRAPVSASRLELAMDVASIGMSYVLICPASSELTMSPSNPSSCARRSRLMLQLELASTAVPMGLRLMRA